MNFSPENPCPPQALSFPKRRVRPRRLRSAHLYFEGMSWPLIGLTLLLACALPLPAQSASSVSNLEREKNWADQIVDFLVVGEPVWLEARGVRFLGLYTRPGRKGTGQQAVILIHGRGVHPAWGFIDSLRVDLADAGWHTLSLQMPILDPEVKFAEYARTFDEAFARIDAGLAFLARQGVRRVALVGHSSGAMTALAYAAERPGRVAAIAAIGLSTEPAGGKRMRPAEILRDIRDTPVLDLYGSEDLPVVREYAQARAAAALAAGNKDYLQVVEQGADHFFSERYEALRAHLARWLASLRR